MALSDHQKIKERLNRLGMVPQKSAEDIKNALFPEPVREVLSSEPVDMLAAVTENEIALNSQKPEVTKIRRKEITRDAVITVRVTKELKSDVVNAAKPGKMATFVENALIDAVKKHKRLNR